MKKIVVFIVSVLLCVAMLTVTASCGNMAMVGNYSYKHIYVETYKTEGHCYTIEKWVDGDTGIEVKTAENGAMFISEGNYIMFQDKAHCPYCHD